MAKKPKLALWALAATIGAVLHAGAASAQALDEAVVRGMNVYKNVGNCARCHAWSGLGARVEEEEGRGLKTEPPKLVNSPLPAEAMEEAVRCGRPGSVMPRHDERAWREYKCYDLTQAEIGKELPDKAPRSLTDAQIKDVVAFIVAFYKAGEMTFAKCEAYYGAGARSCDSYKK
jgi:mono/diheme cytochrome c family protein